MANLMYDFPLRIQVVFICLHDTQKYGRPNEATPATWQKSYTDFSAPLENGTTATPSKPPGKADLPEEETVKDESDELPPTIPQSEIADLNGESKKRKRHEGETPEEKAERKRKKKEKKEKKSKKADSNAGE